MGRLRWPHSAISRVIPPGTGSFWPCHFWGWSIHCSAARPGTGSPSSGGRLLSLLLPALPLGAPISGVSRGGPLSAGRAWLCPAARCAGRSVPPAVRAGGAGRLLAEGQAPQDGQGDGWRPISSPSPPRGCCSGLGGTRLLSLLLTAWAGVPLPSAPGFLPERLALVYLAASVLEAASQAEPGAGMSCSASSSVSAGALTSLRSGGG